MFYRLSWPPDRKYAECGPIAPVYSHDGMERCPLCNSPLEGMYWTHPRTLQISKTKYPDFMFSTPYPAVSERFKLLYEASDLKGILSFDPIDSYKLRKNAPPCDTYYTIRVFRSKMKIDRMQSEISYLQPHAHKCELCDPMGQVVSNYYRLILDESDYEGMDIFRLYETGNAKYLSEKFVEFVRDNHLTNLGISPLTDMSKIIIIK